MEHLLSRKGRVRLATFLLTTAGATALALVFEASAVARGLSFQGASPLFALVEGLASASVLCWMAEEAIQSLLG